MKHALSAEMQSVILRYRILVDQKYASGLSVAEQAEMETLGKQIDEWAAREVPSCREQ